MVVIRGRDVEGVVVLPSGAGGLPIRRSVLA